MKNNAKNRLFDILKSLGCLEECVHFQTTQTVVPPTPENMTILHTTIATVTFADGRVIQATGQGYRRAESEIAACAAAMKTLRATYPDLLINWSRIFVEAQAGDTLIKLGVFLTASLKTASDKAKKLQTVESDVHLAQVFEQWKANGDPDLAMFGEKLSEKRKATLVEALLWRRYQNHVMAADASLQLNSLLQTLQ
ncbi:MAG: hypothetical protein B0A82_12155 [Alkalinema sp. CACIAM 70d]|nr:MAG: hypothetical protein B0A82_12155 [Alkalinema sp. CACIAM 70d]